MKYWRYFKELQASKRYHKQNALSLAIACDLAYEKERKIRHTLSRWGYQLVGLKSVIKAPHIDILSLVMTNDKNLIIVFKGSESFKNWFANIQALYNPGPLEGTKVHQGFQDTLFHIVISLTNLINSAYKRGKKIWITGHSLGAAFSSLYAAMLIENEYPVYGVYTFGSPRVGNEAFQHCLNDHVLGPHFRVVNAGDLVPHVPAEPFFSHSGERIILGEESASDTESSWLEQKIEALQLLAKSTINILDAGDYHRLSDNKKSYVARLIKDIKRQN